jgi:tetratricopeptide (TPR) repeat protein
MEVTVISSSPPSRRTGMTIPRHKREFHRKIAATCFNQAWDYLEMKDRSEEDERQMLHLAHASRYHWGVVGTPRNRAVADWQLSRIYADLGQPQLALQFAKSCLATCERNRLSDIVHTGSEAMARAYAVAKEYSSARRYLSKARQQLEKLALDRKDKEIYSGQLRETERLIEKR